MVVGASVVVGAAVVVVAEAVVVVVGGAVVVVGAAVVVVVMNAVAIAPGSMVSTTPVSKVANTPGSRNGTDSAAPGIPSGMEGGVTPTLVAVPAASPRTVRASTQQIRVKARLASPDLTTVPFPIAHTRPYEQVARRGPPQGNGSLVQSSAVLSTGKAASVPLHQSGDVELQQEVLHQGAKAVKHKRRRLSMAKTVADEDEL